MTTSRLLGDALSCAMDGLGKVLVACWPETAWSLHGDEWAAGTSIRIAWSDGPSVNAVREVSAAFEFPHLPGMADLYITVARQPQCGAKFIVLDRTDTTLVVRKGAHP